MQTIYPPDTGEERALRETIATIEAEYRKAAKPYVDRLAKLYAMKHPTYILEPHEAEAMNLKGIIK